MFQDRPQNDIERRTALEKWRSDVEGTSKVGRTRLREKEGKSFARKVNGGKKEKLH